MAYQIKYLKLGGILDQAIRIVKEHFGLLFSIMLLLLIPFELLTGFIELAMTPDVPPDASTEEILEATQESQRFGPLSKILNIVYLLIVIPVTTAAVIHAVARLYLGQQVTAIEAIKFGFNRLGPLIGTSILMYLAIIGGMILLIIPGILFALWFGLSLYVVVIEGISGSAALGRSKKLVRPHLGTFLILGLIMIAINFGLIVVSFFVPQPHLQVVGYVLLSAVGTILWTAAGVVFYFSCRCAEENFDLHYLAESLGVPEETETDRDPLVQSSY